MQQYCNRILKTLFKDASKNALKGLCALEGVVSQQEVHSGIGVSLTDLHIFQNRFGYMICLCQPDPFSQE